MKRTAVVEEIARGLVRRFSTAAVLLHHAVAERLGLGPADHKCLDLLRERRTMIASDLAAITGLTSGAITGVVARLERAGYLRRETDRHDGRRQILFPVQPRVRDVGAIFEPIQRDEIAALEEFDDRQLAAIAEFLARSTEVAYRHVSLLRGHALSAAAETGQRTPPRQPRKRRARRKATPNP